MFGPGAKNGSDPEAPSISLELSERLAKIFMVEEPDAKARWRAQCGGGDRNGEGVEGVGF